jgi:hypothetical protein
MHTSRFDIVLKRIVFSVLLFAVLVFPYWTCAQASAVKTIFLIVMSNQSWATLKGSPSAPYVNSLLPMAAFPSAYFALSGAHPMGADYFWLEAGSDLGINFSAPPTISHQSTSKHLVSLLENAGISWKAYQEGIDGNECPLMDTPTYTTKSNPFVFFDDVTNNLSSQSPRCVQHVRPYSDFASDLNSNNVARYNFIRPGLCNSMFQCALGVDPIGQGDKWLSQEVPKILASAAYKGGGALFITWDKPNSITEGPVGMILLSPFAKTAYTNTVRYTHASMLRTVQEIFGVLPLLGDTATQPSLEDLFSTSDSQTSAATVSWTASPGATSYKVKRSLSAGGPFGAVATDVASTTYIDRKVSPGLTYFYVVSAVNGKGESAPSAPVTLTIGSAPPAPTNVSAKQAP